MSTSSPEQPAADFAGQSWVSIGAGVPGAAAPAEPAAAEYLLHAEIEAEPKEERHQDLSLAIQQETGLDEAVLEHLVREFYAQARQDPELGQVFSEVRDWDTHIEKICAFWSSVALKTGHYHGQPMTAHLPLGLAPEHFQRWLTLFEATARSCCTPQAVALLMAKANRIAQSLALGIAAQNGILPAPGSPPATTR